MHWLKKHTQSPLFHSLFLSLKRAWNIAHGLFPLTWLSLILIAVIYYVWFWEVSAHANQILFTAVIIWGLAFATLLIFTILSTLIVFLATRHKNKPSEIEIKNETGSRIQTDYRVFVPFFMPFVTIDIKLLETSFERHEIKHLPWSEEYLTPLERGRHIKLHRRITVKDIFGLTEISFVLTQKVSITIEPAKSRYEMLAFQTKTSGDGYSHPEGEPKGELVEMRRYQAGDPLRLVLWKVFARSRKLVVRAPEPAIVEEKDMFVYFVSGKDDESSASMARSFLSGIGLDMSRELSFSTDGAKRLVANEQEGISDIIDSVSHRARGAEDLLTVAPLVAQGAMNHCFLLVPPKPGTWMEHVKKFIAQYSISPTFVLSVDANKSTEKKKKNSAIKRLICKTDDAAENADDIFNQLCVALSKLGSVRIVDISTGAMTEFTGGSQ